MVTATLRNTALRPLPWDVLRRCLPSLLDMWHRFGMFSEQIQGAATVLSRRLASWIQRPQLQDDFLDLFLHANMTARLRLWLSLLLQRAEQSAGNEHVLMPRVFEVCEQESGNSFLADTSVMADESRATEMEILPATPPRTPTNACDQTIPVLDSPGLRQFSQICIDVSSDDDHEEEKDPNHGSCAKSTCLDETETVSVRDWESFFSMAEDNTSPSPFDDADSPRTQNWKLMFQGQKFACSLHSSPAQFSQREAAGQLQEASHSTDAVPVSGEMPSEIVEQLEEEAMLHEVSVPFWYPGQEKFKWGGCKYHCKLSLQPHLTRGGKDFGKLFLRCSSWFKRCPAADKCWYRTEFPRGLFNLLPQHVKDEYASLRMSFARGQ